MPTAMHDYADRQRNREFLRQARSGVCSYVLVAPVPPALSVSGASCCQTLQAIRAHARVGFAQIVWLRPARLYFGVRAHDEADARRLGEQILRSAGCEPATLSVKPS